MSIIERLRDRRYGDVFWMRSEAAELIAQQAKRIKELEAENARLYKAGKVQLAAKHKAAANEKELFNALAALRQRIDDAPVVAEVGSVQGQTAYVFQTSDRALIAGTKLISKEDLK